MAERTLEQLFYEDGLSLREIARKKGIPDSKGAVLFLLNPKTGEKEKKVLGDFSIKAPGDEGKPKDTKAPDVKPKKELVGSDTSKEKTATTKTTTKTTTKPKKSVPQKAVQKPKTMSYDEHYAKLKKLKKGDQVKILRDFGVSWLQRKKLRYEDQRIKKIIELQQ